MQVETGDYSDSQHGAVLIVVLFLIVLLATASAIVIRNAQTSLSLTTASQVNQLLFQSSDVALAQFEKLLNSPTQLALLSAEEGPIGYLLINGDTFKGAEYVMCYHPTIHEHLYAGADKHKIISMDGVHNNTRGYCNIANRNVNHYTSGRKVVVTQVSVIRADDTSSDMPLSSQGSQVEEVTTATHTPTPFQGESASDTGNTVEPQQMTLRVYVTSIIPVLSPATIQEIDDCLSLPIADLAVNDDGQMQGQIACLDDSQTPYNVQVQDYLYTQEVIAVP